MTSRPRRPNPDADGDRTEGVQLSSVRLGESSIHPVGTPSAEYLEALYADIQADGYDVTFEHNGYRHLTRTRPGAKLRDSVREAVKRHAEALASHVRGLKGITQEFSVKLPEDGDVITWVGFDAAEWGNCEGWELAGKPWVRWTYFRRIGDRRPKRWYSYSGDTWET